MLKRILTGLLLGIVLTVSTVIPISAKIATVPEEHYQKSEAWYSADYGYRQKLTVTGSSANLTGYAMMFTVYKNTGGSSSFTVDLNNHCQDDFDDIRFTKSDGTTLLDYWTESYTSGTSAKVWVEFDTLTASPATQDFYIYYDYASATDGSNGANTFDWFDTFTGASLAAHWTNWNTATVSVSGGEVTVTSSSDAWRGIIGNDVSFGTNHLFRTYASLDNTQNVYNFIGLSKVAWTTSVYDCIVFFGGLNTAEASRIAYRTADAAAVTDTSDTQDDSKQVYMATYVSGNVTFKKNDAYEGSSSTHLPSANVYPIMGVYDNPTAEVKAEWYFVEDYVSTSPSIAWSAEESSASAPTVTTGAATSVEATTATGNGNITATGGSNATVRGFQWDTNSGAPYSYSVNESGSFGTGAFTLSLTSLPTGTTIYYRAFATNPTGTGYGAEQTFLTKPAAPTNVSATDGTEYTKVVVTWTKSTGATGYKVYEGSNLLDTLGDVATYDDTTAAASVITPGTASASDGTSTAYVTLSLSGESIANGTTRTYKVKALNATGDSSDSSTDTGYRGHGTLTYQWMRSASGSDANYSDIAGATTDPYNDTSAPKPTSFLWGTLAASDGTYTSYVRLTTSNVPPYSVAYPHGRYWKCKLSATGATSANSTANAGYISWGTVTYQWYRSAGDSDGSYSPIAGGTTNLYNDTTAPAPSITAGTTNASDGSSTTQVNLSLVGTSANNGDGRYYKLQCTAVSHGFSENSTANRGYRGVGSLTYQWYKSSGTGDSGYGIIAGATSSTYADTTAPAPSITAGTASATDGTSDSEVTLSLAGASANNGASRWYYCALTATGATNADSTHNSGYRGVGTLTYQWQRSAADSDATYSNITGATTSTYDDTDGVRRPDGRYYKCVLAATGATGQTTAANRGYMNRIQNNYSIVLALGVIITVLAIIVLKTKRKRVA